MRNADRRAEIDPPDRIEERVLLAHDAARIRIVRLEIRADVVLHPKTMTHLMCCYVSIVRWRQCHFAPPISASVNPKWRPVFRSPIGAGRSAVFRPVVRQDCD